DGLVIFYKAVGDKRTNPIHEQSPVVGTMFDHRVPPTIISGWILSHSFDNGPQSVAVAARGDSRRRGHARGRDGGILAKLAAGVILRLERSAFGGKPVKHMLVLSLTGSYLSGHSEAFTRLPYRP